MIRKKKIVVKAVEEPEVKVEHDKPNNGVVVTQHLDRRDSGTNYSESQPLPSLND